MALTRAILKSNKILEGLTDEQILAIETLSNNDENSVIGSRFSEVYRQMDETIAEHLGIQRNGAEKTYNYLSRAAGEFKAKYADYETIKGENKAFRDKVAELEEKISKGSADQETVKAYKQALADLDAVKAQFADLKKTHDESMAKHEADLFNMKVDSIIESAKGGLKFRKGVNEQMIGLALKDAISKVKGFNPGFIDDGKGGKALVFRNADGTTMNNAENQLRPFTAQELLKRELSSYDILDNGRTQGSGSQGGSQQQQQMTLSGVSTRVQATKAIEGMLSAKGLVRGTLEYQNQFDKMYAENNVSSLPIGSNE